MVISRGGLDVHFLIFVDEDIDTDIYFQYLRMWMLKIMQISGNADANIRFISIRDGRDVDFSIFADADINFHYLRMWILKIMPISVDEDVDIRSTSSR